MFTTVHEGSLLEIRRRNAAEMTEAVGRQPTHSHNSLVCHWVTAGAEAGAGAGAEAGSRAGAEAGYSPRPLFQLVHNNKRATEKAGRREQRSSLLLKPRTPWTDSGAEGRKFQ